MMYALVYWEDYNSCTILGVYKTKDQAELGMASFKEHMIIEGWSTSTIESEMRAVGIDEVTVGHIGSEHIKRFFG